MWKVQKGGENQPGKLPDPGWVTPDTGCVPGLGARSVNQVDDLPYSLIMV